LDVGVRSILPTVTKDQLAATYRSGAINREDYDKLDQKLSEVQNHAKDEAKSDVRFRHSQAEGLVKEGLRFQNPLEVINQASQQTMASALDDFLSQSAATGGKVDPFTAARATVDKYLPTVAAAAESRLQVQRATSGMKWRTQDELSTDYYNKSKDDAYYAATRRFKEWQATEEEIQRMRGTLKAVSPKRAAIPAAPSGGPTNPPAAGQVDQYGRPTP
jgi:hypothetical protein